MEILHRLLAIGDAILIAPFRWPADPAWGWWLGTAVLCLWAVIIGELTFALGVRLNRAHLREVMGDTADRHRQSINALRAGDKQSWRGINKLANEAFGKAFFFNMALGMSTLWPAFLAGAWLDARFRGVPIPIPLTAWEINFIPGLVATYLVVRITFGRLKKRIPFCARTLQLAAGQDPAAGRPGPAGPAGNPDGASR